MGVREHERIYRGGDLMPVFGTSGGGGVTGTALAAQLKVKQTPTPVTDGVTVLFTCPDAYVAGSLHVFVDGVLKDYALTETSPAAGTFTLSFAPLAAEDLKVDYVKV